MITSAFFHRSSSIMVERQSEKVKIGQDAKMRQSKSRGARAGRVSGATYGSQTPVRTTVRLAVVRPYPKEDRPTATRQAGAKHEAKEAWSIQRPTDPSARPT